MAGVTLDRQCPGAATASRRQHLFFALSAQLRNPFVRNPAGTGPGGRLVQPPATSPYLKVILAALA